ncbi:MAG: hypothetical protein MZV65_41220 [Chromatiales bacterium]|nr:hypothetical protein [Chromatiales bacterium]
MAREARGADRRYELIFLDPPTFSTSKRMQGTLDIQRDHVALIQAAARLLEPRRDPGLFLQFPPLPPRPGGAGRRLPSTT